MEVKVTGSFVPVNFREVNHNFRIFWNVLPANLYNTELSVIIHDIIIIIIIIGSTALGGPWLPHTSI
jgi:hypothetical protein